MLAIFIARVKEDGQIQGLIPHLVDDGFQSYSTLMTPSFLWSMILSKQSI
jgi:hypothetical protein